MRKNLLSLSIAAMIGGLGLTVAGTAGAVAAFPAGNLGTASGFTASNTGVGHILLVPYFSTQNGNATLLSIVNTDSVNGKAVKVRFRSAANSDDIFDFQLFLSPNDVWTANISQNTTTGLSQLTTGDASCTLPSAITLNSTPFSTNRLPTVTSTFTAATQASWTREGYVEILNMADINPSTTTGNLFTAIKHVNGVPPGCPSMNSTAAIFTTLSTYTGITSVFTQNTSNAPLATAGTYMLSNPTGGLFGGATIINTAGAAVAWSGNDYALMATNGGGVANFVFSPQMANPATATGGAAAWTADPLMNGTSAPITALDYDLPDLSTPYVTAASTPLVQAQTVAGVLATTSIMNEYLVTSAISAATDWTFTLATRRYSVAYNYAGTSANTTVAMSTAIPPAPVNASANKLWWSGDTEYFAPSTNTVGSGSGNVSVGTTNPLLLCVNGITPTGFDQEETTVTPGTFVVSPGPSQAQFYLCGEASVLSFSSNTVLGATVAPSTVSGRLPGSAGWMSIATPGMGGQGYGLPILGASYEQATGSPVAGKSTNFGISYQHRYTRPSPF